MVASSLQAAKDLATLCELRDATRARNGVLFGKGEVEFLQRDERLSIKDYFRNTPGFSEAPDTATAYRSAFVKETSTHTCGVLSRSSSFIFSLLQGNIILFCFSIWYV